MKTILRIITVIFLVLVLVLGGRNFLAKASFENVCRIATGLKLQIGQFDLALGKSTVLIKELKLFNPSSFSQKVMFSLPEVYVDYDLPSIWKGQPHLREVRLHLAELAIEKNKQGILNLNYLKPAGGDKKNETKKSTAAAKLQIDTLSIRIDKVSYSDFSGPSPIVQNLDLNMQETYHNIQDVRAIAPILVSKVLTNSALRSIVNFKVDDLLKNFEASGINLTDLGLDKISGLGAGLTEKATKGIENFFGSLSKN